jgi:predicted small metal-binding protein
VVKQFDCADVVPGCGATFRAGSVAEVLEHGKMHSIWAHGMSEADFGPELTAMAESVVRDVA